MELSFAVNALGALAQGTRLAFFRLLVEYGPEGLPAGRISEALDLPPATLSFHLKELARARLIRARSEGRFIFYRADFEAMGALIAYLTDNCCSAGGVCDSSRTPPAPVGTVHGPWSTKPTIHPKRRFA